jgi:hypothetical protein
MSVPEGAHLAVSSTVHKTSSGIASDLNSRMLFRLHIASITEFRIAGFGTLLKCSP